MSMEWTNLLPTKPGFYYWQDRELYNISRDAVRIVQVSQYLHRPGLSAQSLQQDGFIGPAFDCDLDRVPRGRWAGPLPQPIG